MNADIDISGVVLRTERLTLRPWRQSDLDDFYRYARVDGVGQMAGWKPHESIEESQRILDSFIARRKTFALDRNGRAIGSLGIEEYDEERFPEFSGRKCREIGYVLSREYWGQGLMPEAVGEVIRYLFDQVGLDAIFCGHFIWNRQSGRVQEKCGFRHYAYGRFETKAGTVEDEEFNLLTRDQWIWDRIRTVGGNKKQYLPLLLLADEQENMIDRYLDRGTMFVVEDHGIVKAEAVVTDEGDGVAEIKSLAVAPEFQRRGYGRAMIRFLAKRYKNRFSVLQAGTGDSPLTVPFYERCGFVRHHADRNFFPDHYDHPIFEGGIQLTDMVYLRMPLSGQDAE